MRRYAVQPAPFRSHIFDQRANLWARSSVLAEAIAEAATRLAIRFVELKSAERLDMQSLHRVRDRLIRERTARCVAVLVEIDVAVVSGGVTLSRHAARSMH